MWKLMAVLGISVLLAGCNSVGTAPDGSGSGRITDLRTEYATSPNQYVACNGVTNPDDFTRANATQVVLDFSAAGTIQYVEVELRGMTSNANNANFSRTFTRSELLPLPNGDYRVIFDADASIGQLLPTSIIVRPNDPLQPVKSVSSTNQQAGAFYAWLRIDTGTSSFDLSSVGLRTIPVYRSCTLEGELSEL